MFCNSCAGAFNLQTGPCTYLSTWRALHNVAHCSIDSFRILDNASTPFQLKVKEAIYMQLEKPSLSAQVKHVNLKLSL